MTVRQRSGWRKVAETATISQPTIKKMAITEQSTALSKDLKNRGWTFVGPTTCYAFMQAIGLVNDHVHDCHVRAEIEQARKRFKRPTS